MVSDKQITECFEVKNSVFETRQSLLMCCLAGANHFMKAEILGLLLAVAPTDKTRGYTS